MTSSLRTHLPWSVHSESECDRGETSRVHAVVYKKRRTIYTTRNTSNHPLLRTKTLAAFFLVVAGVTVAVPDVLHVPAVLEHVDGDDVVVYTFRFRVNAGEAPVAVLA